MLGWRVVLLRPALSKSPLAATNLLLVAQFRFCSRCAIAALFRDSYCVPSPDIPRVLALSVELRGARSLAVLPNSFQVPGSAVATFHQSGNSSFC